MANLDDVLQQLREEHKQAQLQVGKLNEAISVIEGLVTASSETSANGARPRRTVSAATRRRMVQAQRARWAKVGKGPQPLSAGKAGGAAPKRTLSIAARRKIAAAQRARWAKVRAQEKKAA
jgi:hypothetical protein